MKKQYLLLSLALVAGMASARQISVDEARSIAAHKVPSLAKSALRVQPKGNALSETSAPLYMFNSPNGGFAIVAGDDRMPNMLLAYSDNGAIDLDNCSPAMQAWLEEMASFISAGDFSSVRRVSSLDYSNPVSPLLTTKWNQDEPYNLLTPVVASGAHCATGCGATAMAQVVNYWKWPKNGGLAEHSYEWNGQTLSVDFRESRYDWDNMADIYDENSTEAQNNAVAKLMWDCGVATDMMYDEDMSSTSDMAVALGLIDFFGYNPGLRYLKRDYFPTEEWFAMVKNELDSARPVPYCGATPKREGHAFVCDGYDESGLYHINWGWGGMCDGYFDLSTLDPEAQGIGGAASAQGFSEQQSIIIGLRPAQDGDETPVGWQLAIDDWGIKCEEEGSPVFSIEWEIANFGLRPFEGEVYLSLSREGHLEETEEALLAECKGENALASQYSNTIEINGLDASQLEDGTYKVELSACDVSGNEADLWLHQTLSPVQFEVKDGKLVVESVSCLEISDIDVDERGFFFTAGNTRSMLTDLKFNVTNNSETAFNDGIALTVTYPAADGESIEDTYALIDIPNIGSGESVALTVPVIYNVEGRVKVAFAPCGRSEGDTAHDVEFNPSEFEFDADGVYCELALAEIPEVNEENGTVTISAKVGNCTGELVVEDSLSIDTDAVTEREVVCTIFNEASKELSSTTNAIYSGTWNEIKTLAFTTEQPLANGNYYAELRYKSAPTDSGEVMDLMLGEEVEDFPGIKFKVISSGIAGIRDDNDGNSTEIYSISGVRLSSGSNLAPGCYMEVRGGKVQKKVISGR